MSAGNLEGGGSKFFFSGPKFPPRNEGLHFTLKVVAKNT